MQAEWLVDRRDMRLVQAVLFVTAGGKRIYVPEGFVTNGLSVPRFFWRCVQPFEPFTRDASVVHDWLVGRGWDWSDAADVFYQAMRCRGTSAWRAWIRWAAVRWFGGWFQRWGR